MSKKIHNINKITSKDKSMLMALAKTGYISVDMIQGKLGVAERRVQAYTRDELLEKGIYFDSKTKKTVAVYKLSDKGKRFVTRNLGVDRFYRSSSVKHDLALANIYLGLNTGEQQTWRTESHVRDQFIETLANMRNDDRREELWDKYQNHQISAIDACYTTSDGQQVGVEITTSAYGDAEIAAKEEFCAVLGVDTQYIRI